MYFKSVSIGDENAKIYSEKSKCLFVNAELTPIMHSTTLYVHQKKIVKKPSHKSQLSCALVQNKE